MDGDALSFRGGREHGVERRRQRTDASTGRSKKRVTRAFGNQVGEWSMVTLICVLVAACCFAAALLMCRDNISL
jgi:hypothetical protein